MDIKTQLCVREKFFAGSSSSLCCRPPHKMWLNLVTTTRDEGEMIKGDTIQSSVCEYSMLTNVNSQYCCTFSKMMSIHIERPAQYIITFFCFRCCHVKWYVTASHTYTLRLTNQNVDVNITSLFSNQVVWLNVWRLIVRFFLSLVLLNELWCSKQAIWKWYQNCDKQMLSFRFSRLESFIGIHCRRRHCCRAAWLIRCYSICISTVFHSY